MIHQVLKTFTSDFGWLSLVCVVCLCYLFCGRFVNMEVFLNSHRSCLFSAGFDFSITHPHTFVVKGCSMLKGKTPLLYFSLFLFLS